MKKLLIASLLILPALNPASAEVEEYHCLNKEMAVINEELARQNPQDSIVIKLVALRSGLCDLVEKGIIETEFAIDLFDAEKSKGFMKRLEEDVTNNTEVGA